MMNEHQDEASETVRAGVRTAMSVAAQAAQVAIRALEQRRREIQAASEQRAAELTARFDAERAAARAALAPVGSDDWWATARPDQITTAYETAREWEDFDSDARLAADRIRGEVSARYGVDPISLDRAAHLDRDAAEQRDEEQLDDAAALIAGVDGLAEANERNAADTEYQSASQQRADALWDSAERRAGMANSLEGRASAEAVNVRMIVDTGQGKPAREAVTRPPAKAVGHAKSSAVGKGVAVQPGRRPRA